MLRHKTSEAKPETHHCIEITILIHPDNESDCTNGHWDTTSAAVIRDLKNEDNIFVVKFAEPGAIDPDRLSEMKTLLKDPTSSYFKKYQSVTVSSNQSYDGFLEKYLPEFKDPESFCFPFKKCSDATNFVLDHFFPETKNENNQYTLKKLFCIGSTLATCGTFRALSLSPCVTTPQSVFDRALKIAELQKLQDAKKVVSLTMKR